jgi:hypothetical protein
MTENGRHGEDSYVPHSFGGSRCLGRDFRWRVEITFTRFGEPDLFRTCHLKTGGEKLTGQSGDVKIVGTTHGDSMRFEVRQADGKRVVESLRHPGRDVLVGTGKISIHLPPDGTHLAERPRARERAPFHAAHGSPPARAQFRR